MLTGRAFQSDDVIISVTYKVIGELMMLRLVAARSHVQILSGFLLHYCACEMEVKADFNTRCTAFP